MCAIWRMNRHVEMLYSSKFHMCALWRMNRHVGMQYSSKRHTSALWRMNRHVGMQYSSKRHTCALWRMNRYVGMQYSSKRHMSDDWIDKTFGLSRFVTLIITKFLCSRLWIVWIDVYAMMQHERTAGRTVGRTDERHEMDRQQTARPRSAIFWRTCLLTKDYFSFKAFLSFTFIFSGQSLKFHWFFYIISKI